MGQTCKKIQNKQQKTTTYQLSQLPGYPNILFNFTSDKLKKADCDCVIIFGDKHNQLKNNQYLKKCNDKVAKRIQQYFDIQVKDRDIQIGQSIFVDLSKQQYGFSTLVVICLQLFQGRSFYQKNNPFYMYFKNALTLIKQKKFNSIMIVQFNEQFGLPKQLSYKIILDALNSQKDGFKQIGFIFYNDNSLKHIKSLVQNYKQQQIKTHPTFSKDSKISQYY